MSNPRLTTLLTCIGIGVSSAGILAQPSSAITQIPAAQNESHSVRIGNQAQPWHIADAVETAKIYYQRAQTKAKAKDYQGAIADYSEVIRLVPDYDKPYIFRANLKDVTGDPAGALEDYQKAIAINPNRSLAYYNRAVTLERMEKYPDAIADYSKTIQLDPNFVSAHKNRGLNYLKVKDMPRAVQDFKNASALYKQSGNRQGYQQMQQILKALGQ